MNKEILVDANTFATRVAVVEDGTPVELYVEQEGSERLVGNIYLGKVQNVLPGMQAAFVDIGLEKTPFYMPEMCSSPGISMTVWSSCPRAARSQICCGPARTYWCR